MYGYFNPRELGFGWATPITVADYEAAIAADQAASVTAQ
jgi:hypothetical protein